MTHNGKKNTKKIWRIQKLSLPLHRKQQKMVQTYGAMVAQQILVLLVEVRILIGLQALRQKWRRAFLLHKQCRNCHFFLCKETFYPKKFLYKERFLLPLPLLQKTSGEQSIGLLAATLTNSRRTTHGNNLKRIDTANIHTKNQTSKQKCKIFYKKWHLQTTQSIDKCKCLYVYICYYQKYMTEWRKIKPRRGVISKTCA